ncbi:MAG: helix-turn-helix domain protein [Mu-like cryoconite phage AB09]|nr:MAG: helix-turn-helix domain protein [Mu-like cryoconite phage AB09]
MLLDEKPPNLLGDEFFTEDEILQFLNVSRNTFTGRRSRATDHPPYVQVGRVRLYPKREFRSWINRQPLMRAARNG